MITSAPPRYRLDVTPRDLGLPYENVEFLTSDGIKLVGWLIAGEKKKPTILIVHGLGAAKEDVIQKAPFLYRGGYSVFLFDLRGHGQSDAGKLTFGYNEKLDVLAAIEFLKNRNDISHEFVLWGLSLGAASSILAAVESEDIKAVISESSFDSLKDAIAHHAKSFFFLPRFPLVSMTMWMAELRMGFDFDEVDIVKAISKLSPRLLFIVNGKADRRMTTEVAEKLYNAAGEPKQIWHVPAASHAEAFYLAREEYETRVLDLLRKYFGTNEK